MKFNETVIVEEESFYVIVLKFRGEQPYRDDVTKKMKIKYYDRFLFFKADRYSAYGGRLQTESYPKDAMKWKTPEGAQGAMKRFISKDVIKDHQEPKVCKYTHAVTTRFDVVASDPANTIQAVTI